MGGSNTAPTDHPSENLQKSALFLTRDTIYYSLSFSLMVNGKLDGVALLVVDPPSAKGRHPSKKSAFI